ncbi:TPA: hypothetical protein HA265_03545 [Candidatus Woesearchaeota archaeon]|nr:hypothetical protein [Candidatus Woesearchaeota archaeon]
MSLYTLLKDRASINILKILYDNESSNKSYTMDYSELRRCLSTPESPLTINNLEHAGLVTVEANGSSSKVLAITKKGKMFIDRFDRLKLVLDGKKTEEKAYKIKYDLTEDEQAVLSKVDELTKGGHPITLTVLEKNLFPRNRAGPKRGVMTRHMNRLVQLNLLEKIKKSNKFYYDITKSGERVVQEQFR